MTGSIEGWIKGAFERAFPGNDFSSVRVLPATDAKFGDFQCNDALKFKKVLGVNNPREIAQKVLDAGGKPDFIEKLEIAGPGFINITVSSGWLDAQLATLAAASELGVPQTGAVAALLQQLHWFCPHATFICDKGHMAVIGFLAHGHIKAQTEGGDHILTLVSII